MAVAGRMGMTKALKRAARLAGMASNRKRDKASQRASYHKLWRNAPGQPPLDRAKLGFTGSAE